MSVLNIVTLNRDYIDVNSEDLHINYANCMISTPRRFSTINNVIYPEIYNDPNTYGIVKGLYLIVQNTQNSVIFKITGGVIKSLYKLIYVRPITKEIPKNSIINTFPNNTDLTFNIRIIDNVISNPNTENYIDAEYFLATSIYTPQNETDLTLTLYKLTKDSNGNLTVDYEASLQYRLL